MYIMPPIVLDCYWPRMLLEGPVVNPFSFCFEACHDGFQKCSKKICKGDQNCDMQASPL